MKKFAFNADFFASDSKAVSFINDWYDLSIQIGVQPYKLSYAKKFRKDLQEKIVLGKGSEKRVVYKSKSSLAEIQSKLMPLMCSLIEEVPNEQMIAYRKGVNAVKEISKLVDKRYLIKFDIKKYYDHVSTWHIQHMLQTHGFTKLGAQLVANYCVVDRGGFATLQQGSPVSPVISNLAGYEFIDKFVLSWIKTFKEENPNVECFFYRYSDNIVVSLDSPEMGNITPAHLDSFKKHIINSLSTVGLRTHKWSIIPNTHPKRNQKFLGVILNKIARIEKDKYSQWRATLFNACKNGLETSAKNYWDHMGRGLWATQGAGWMLPAAMVLEADVARFTMVLNGRNSYLNSISAKQGLELKKLYQAALYLNDESPSVYTHEYSVIPPTDKSSHWCRLVVGSLGDGNQTFITNKLKAEKMAVLKGYKDFNETIESYLDRLRLA